MTHKGVDIFAKGGAKIYSPTNGLILFGGKIILILGPKWRLHYYAHLNEINISKFSFVSKKSIIGTTGTSDNAKEKAPHLHYSLITLVPYILEN